MRKFALHWKPRWSTLGDEYLVYAEVYKDSIEVLVKYLDEQGHHDYAPLPMLFLLRHYMELQLTGLIMNGAFFSANLNHGIQEFLTEKRKNHNLMRLFNKLGQFEKKLDFPKDFTEFLANLDQFDEKSDRFRYPENRNGVSYFTKDLVNNKFVEIINNFNLIKKYTNVVIDFLEGIEAYFESLKEGKIEEMRINQEILRDYQN